MFRYLLMFSLLFLTNFSFAQPEMRIIVKYKTNQENLTQEQVYKKTLKKLAFNPVKKVEEIAGNAFVLTFKNPNAKLTSVTPDNTLEAIIKRLKMDPEIQYAVEDRVSYFKPFINIPSTQPYNIPSHKSQWNHFLPPAGIMLESESGLKDGAWLYSTGFMQEPIVIGVLDTGIAENTSIIDNLVKDENGKIWGWNFADNNRNLKDATNSFHGTHVAGIIASYGQTISGVGKDLKILVLKIPDSNGMFYESWVINALYWSVGGNVPGIPENTMPAKVLNMSFGIDIRPGKELSTCDEALQDAIDFVRSKNAVMAVAAGNDNKKNGFNAPASCNGLLKIAATGPEGLRSYYSNYGEDVSLAAPGGDLRYGMRGGILSTVNPYGGYLGTGFDFFQGTSMASPHAAGVAGLVIAASNDTLSVDQIEKILTYSAHKFGETINSNYSCIGNKTCGHGILDANLAVLSAIEHFDAYFKAPDSHNDDTYPWEKVRQTKQSTPYSYVKQNKSGNIYAYSGNTKYILLENDFKDCKIISFNGVGCHK